jgi:FKBP-type peptidyl-prolyl cis-trans isomerase 2
MKTKTIIELIEMCVTGNCSIRLEACRTGVVARVNGERGDVAVETSVYLDANDPLAGQKLDNAIRRIKEIA